MAVSIFPHLFSTDQAVGSLLGLTPHPPSLPSWIYALDVAVLAEPVWQHKLHTAVTLHHT